MKGYLAAAAACLLATSASAATYSDTQLQTVGGQDFVFSFAGVDAPAAAGEITIEARGDYSYNFDFLEYLTWDLEGVAGGSLAPFSAAIATNWGDDDDWKFLSSFSLTLAQLQAVTADGVINVTINLADDVDLFAPGVAFASASVSYDSIRGGVPEPSTWAVMLLGFGAAGGMLRRRRELTARACG